MEKAKHIDDLIEWAQELDGNAEFVAVADEIGGKFIVVSNFDGEAAAFVEGFLRATDSAEVQVYRISVADIYDARMEGPEPYRNVIERIRR